MAGLILETFPGAGLVPPPHPGAPPRRRGGTLSGADPGILPAVLRADANLVVWHRELPAPFTAALRTLAVAAPFTAVAEAAPEAAPEALAADLPAPAPLDLLIDIGRLAIAFAAVADTGCAVRLRLEVIAGPACYRWHADAVGLRLLCTYRGLGTEWLPLAGGARVARGLDGAALPCTPARIATGAVAVLKGERFPGNAGFGCIHRSPPAGPGERARLLLCIDEPGRIPLEPCAARRTAP